MLIVAMQSVVAPNMEHGIIILSLIVEGAAKKVSQFVILLKSIYNKKTLF